MSPPLKERGSVYPKDYGLAISDVTRITHPDIIRAFDQRLSDFLIRVYYTEHDNRMPLYLVGRARRTIMLLWVNGDNYREAFAEIDLVGSALTASPDAAGANTEELIMMFPFADFRGHKRTRKRMKRSDRAIVQAEGVTNIALVKKLKHVARASAVVTVDVHNLWETGQQFEQEELELINLTTNQLLVDYLLRKGLLSDDLETIVASVDIGNLPNAHDLSIRLGKALGLKHPLPLSINEKSRVDSLVQQEVISSDVEVKGRRVIVGDDMISSGGTTRETVINLLEDGAGEVIFYAPHAVFVKDYYQKLADLLSNPKVKLIISDSLPFIREGRSVSIPYGFIEDAPENEVQVIKIGEWLAERAEIILQAKSLGVARELLQDEIIDPIDPYELFTQLTGQELETPIDTGIYFEGGRIESLYTVE